MRIAHQPVLKAEVFEWLKPAGEGGLLIDGTLGEGGHGEIFLKACPALRLVGIDADPSILSAARQRLTPLAAESGSPAAPGGLPRLRLFNTWFDQFFNAYPLGEERPDRILLDLGISVFHYQEGRRGFSFLDEEALDMRLNPDLDLSAADIVNTVSESRLADIFFNYGEERYARRIARALAEARKKSRITGARELADLIRQAVPPAYRYGRIHPATRCFQSLRIAVNRELDRLEAVLPAALGALKPGGRMGVISFHSLEDRRVKTFFRMAEKGRGEGEAGVKGGGEWAGGGFVKVLTKKPIVPGDEERESNPPSRSAKFRVVEKLKDIPV